MVPTPQSPEHEKSSSAQTHEQRVRSLSIACTGVLGLFLVFVLGDLLARSGSQLALAAVPYVFCFGVVFLVFYVVAYIGHSKLAKAVGGQLASQAALAVFVWFMYTQASLQVGILLNQVYGVDPSVFSSSSQILNFVLMFVLSRPLLYLAVAINIVMVLNYVFRHRKSPLSKLTAAILLSGTVIGVLSLVFIHERFNDELLLKKAYLIAKEQDFNMRVRCGGADVPGIGVFMGPEQRRVLMDDTPSTMSWTASIYATKEDLAHVQIPTQFKILRCED